MELENAGEEDPVHALRAHRAVEETGATDPTGTGWVEVAGHADTGPGLPRSLHARLPRTQRHVRREGPGSGDPSGDGGVHPRARDRLLLHRTPEADGDRRHALLSGPAVLSPQAATPGGGGPEDR